jgi:hypothetical protein
MVMNSVNEFLRDKCVNVVVKNISSRPVEEGRCPAPLMRLVTSMLPTDLDPTIAALYVL